MKLTRAISLFAALTIVLPPLAAAPPAEPPLVPWPKSVTLGDGELALTAKSRIVAADAKLVPLARVLAEEVERATGLRLEADEGKPAAGDIGLSLDPTLKREAYRLGVTDHVSVAGADYNGAAQGTVTLIQAIRSENGKVLVPHLTVADEPAFRYHGAMIDVARKPHSIATLKLCVEVCRFYKVRYLQLHMTDENAWTFPSTKFPKLGSQNFAWAGGEKPTVYKLDELKELVAYADARGVTLVPELEMPGHSGQLRGTLPETFGYTDDKGKTVTPGVINMVREETFAALDTLIGEAAEIFKSSPYIHIGCDEASIAEVENLPEIKAFVAKHKLQGGSHAAFNAFVNRMHGIVKKHGKQMIVWEGARVDPVRPPKDVLLMPWVGGSTLADWGVKNGYSVINAPWGVAGDRFNPYQVNGSTLKTGEPLLYGATLVCWEMVEENTLLALRQGLSFRCETTHNPASDRSPADLFRRLRGTDELLDRLMYGVAVRSEGTIEPTQVGNRLNRGFVGTARLSFDAPAGGKVRYTLDGTDPTAASLEYAKPIALTRSATLKARWYAADGTAGPVFIRDFRQRPQVKHDAVGATVTATQPKSGPPAPNPAGLTDGLLADGDQHSAAGWVAFGETGPIEVVIDLGKPVAVRHVAARSMRGAFGLALPKQVEFAASLDGKEYRPLAKIDEASCWTKNGWYAAEVPETQARYLKITATRGGPWTYFDEVTVNANLPGPTLAHAARGKPVTLAHPPSPVYSATGIAGLTDGITTRSPDFGNLPWLGWEGKNIEATIDLGKETEIRNVGANFLQCIRVGIFIPGVVEVSVSDDGKTFRPVATIKHAATNRPEFIQVVQTNLDGVKGRYVRLVARTNGMWLFADEIFVNPEPDAAGK